MNDLQKKEIQRDLNISVLIHYLKMYTICTLHFVHISSNPHGCLLALSPHMCQMGEMRLSSQKLFPRQAHSILPPSPFTLTFHLY